MDYKTDKSASDRRMRLAKHKSKSKVGFVCTKTIKVGDSTVYLDAAARTL